MLITIKRTTVFKILHKIEILNIFRGFFIEVFQKLSSLEQKQVGETELKEKFPKEIVYLLKIVFKKHFGCVPRPNPFSTKT